MDAGTTLCFRESTSRRRFSPARVKNIIAWNGRGLDCWTRIPRPFGCIPKYDLQFIYKLYTFRAMSFEDQSHYTVKIVFRIQRRIVESRNEKNADLRVEPWPDREIRRSYSSFRPFILLTLQSQILQTFAKIKEHRSIQVAWKWIKKRKKTLYKLGHFKIVRVRRKILFWVLSYLLHDK